MSVAPILATSLRLNRAIELRRLWETKHKELGVWLMFPILGSELG